MKDVDRFRMIHHRSRAESFVAGMKLLVEDIPNYGGSVALLAVHSAISFNDAVLIACGGRRSNEEDHRVAARPLQQLCEKRKIDLGGVKHFIWLIGHKNEFAYGDRPLTANDAKAAVVAAERFQAWVYRSFPEMKYEDDSAG
jgi:hypothetical protein